MKLPDTLTDEQHEALISIIRLLAAHGRAIRLQREQAEKENRADLGEEDCEPHDDPSKATGDKS